MQKTQHRRTQQNKTATHAKRSRTATHPTTRPCTGPSIVASALHTQQVLPGHTERDGPALERGSLTNRDGSPGATRGDRTTTPLRLPAAPPPSPSSTCCTAPPRSQSAQSSKSAPPPAPTAGGERHWRLHPQPTAEGRRPTSSPPSRPPPLAGHPPPGLPPSCPPSSRRASTPQSARQTCRASRARRCGGWPRPTLGRWPIPTGTATRTPRAPRETP